MSKRLFTPEQMERRRITNAAWKSANPDKCKAAAAKYRAANPDRRRDSVKKSRESHRDEYNATRRIKYSENSEYFKEFTKKWRISNRENIRASEKKWREANPNLTLKYTVIKMLGIKSDSLDQFSEELIEARMTLVKIRRLLREKSECTK